KSKFSNFTYRLKSIFSVYGNYYFHEIAGVRGIRRFLRSTTIILPAISTYYMMCLIYSGKSQSGIGVWITFIIIALIIPFFLIRLSGLMKFYESCAYLERAFLICNFYGKEDGLKGNNAKILEFITTHLSENKKEKDEE
ncbi:MAG: hypothetical protein H7246_21100, partial [Phycisphaerae bacterium]|nr:hypothetical protein [Saprospiraceae bacterium]